MQYEMGGVYVFTNPTITPQKNKYHIFLFERGYLWHYFFINSEQRTIYKPHLPILQSQCLFLKHDSYISCNIQNLTISHIQNPIKIGEIDSAIIKQAIETYKASNHYNDNDYEYLNECLIENN